jgi:hypothetical protein
MKCEEGIISVSRLILVWQDISDARTKSDLRNGIGILKDAFRSTSNSRRIFFA